MRLAIIPLIASAILHLIGFALAGFVSFSLFLLFPAALYSVLSVGLWRGMTWVTLVCMVGGCIGTVIEFTGPLIAPAPLLVGIILADLVAAGLLIRALWRSQRITNAR